MLNITRNADSHLFIWIIRNLPNIAEIVCNLILLSVFDTNYSDIQDPFTELIFEERLWESLSFCVN